jgi:uncharacterized protein YjiS (DUF1127 family)
MAAISLHSSSRAPLAGTLTAFAKVIGIWRERVRERRELTLLDARSLRDLGLNPTSIQFEANKPFWRD